jgi:predicted unusual protein kinase regulating ubiquinone biosynthesis (AarF/ABC1/UbiB family)
MIFFTISKCLVLSYLIKLGLYNEKLVKILIKNIYKCGVIPVKMIQWGLPYMKLIKIDKKILNILENTYEKCPIHDLKHTKELYNKDFYNELDKDYDIIDIIGSGSIAQVYKIKDKKGKQYAMKVKHPNAHADFRTIKFYLKIIFTILPFNKIIPISLSDFFNQFEEQLNFVNESNNMIKFRELYHNNNLFKIPKIYKLSKNIIIMEYIPGKSLDTIKNNIEHYKYHLYIYVFSNNNLLLNDFNHGDLHNYNWKITEDNKIVIYDFGLCWGFNSEHIIDNMSILNDGFYSKDNKLIYKAFYNYIRYGSNIEERYIKNYFDSIPKRIDRFMDLSYYLIDFCITRGVLMNVKLLYNIISYQNMYLIFMGNFNNCDNDYNGVCKEEYNICDYYDILPEYQLFLKKVINKYKNKNDYTELNKFIT